MALIDTTEYQEIFTAFMNGEVVESSKPDIIGCLPSDLEVLLRNQKLRDDYHTRIRYQRGLNGEMFRWVDAPDIAGFDEASEQFCSIAGIARAKMHVRCGRFSRRVQIARDSEYDPALKHLDSRDGAEEFEPVFTSLMVIGAGTIVHVGRVRRAKNANGPVVEPISGRSYSLRSGIVYRLKPTTAHWEPRAPFFPRTRYFWDTRH